MRVTSAGNVGIGTTNPASKLDVNGALTTGNISARGDGSEGGQITLLNAANSAGPLTLDVDASGNGRLITTVNNANLSLGQLSGTGGIIQFYTANDERMRITSAGNVGIGTINPGAKLDVAGGSVRIANNQGLAFRNAAGTGFAAILLQSDDNFVASNAAGTPIFSFTQAASPIAIYGANSTNRMSFDAGSNAVFWATNGLERMRIDSAGSVGIGTSADVCALLDVSSTTKGFLPPRMSTAQRDAIGGATQEGLILYNVTTDKLQVFAAGAWVNLH